MRVFNRSSGEIIVVKGIFLRKVRRNAQNLSVTSGLAGTSIANSLKLSLLLYLLLILALDPFFLREIGARRTSVHSLLVRNIGANIDLVAGSLASAGSAVGPSDRTTFTWEFSHLLVVLS